MAGEGIPNNALVTLARIAALLGLSPVTDNAAIRGDGTAGKLQNSVVIIGDTGDTTGVGALSISGDMTFADAKNSIYGTTTGHKHGTSTSQKQAFYNATPIVQPSGDVATALSALGLVASPTVTAAIADDSTFRIIGSGDATKKLAFEVDAQTTGKTLTLNTGAQTVDRSLTAPVLTGNRILAIIDQAQTFTALETFSAGLAFANETLSTYDEGTFTPTILGDSTAGTPTYVNQVGKYTRIGNLVTIVIRVKISAKTGIAGNIQIGGLPFPVVFGSGSDAASAAIGVYDGFTFSAGLTQLTGYAQHSTSVIALYASGSATASVRPTDAGLAAASEIFLTMTYQV